MIALPSSRLHALLRLHVTHSSNFTICDSCDIYFSFTLQYVNHLTQLRMRTIGCGCGLDLIKDTRSSDSSRKSFVRKVREIDVVVNWSITMLVVREGC